MPRLTWEQIDELYDLGCSLSECARISEVNKSTIYSRWQRMGKVLRNRGPAVGEQRLSNGEFDRTRELYESGLSTVEVGKALHISHTTVNYRLRKAGVQIRSAGEQIRVSYERGLVFGGRLQKKGQVKNGQSRPRTQTG